MVFSMNKKRLTIEIDEDLKKAFKIEVAKEGVTLKQAVEELIKEFVLSRLPHSL